MKNFKSLIFIAAIFIIFLGTYLNNVSPAYASPGSLGNDLCSIVGNANTFSSGTIPKAVAVSCDVASTLMSCGLTPFDAGASFGWCGLSIAGIANDIDPSLTQNLTCQPNGCPYVPTQADNDVAAYLGCLTNGDTWDSSRMASCAASNANGAAIEGPAAQAFICQKYPTAPGCSQYQASVCQAMPNADGCSGPTPSTPQQQQQQAAQSCTHDANCPACQGPEGSMNNATGISGNGVSCYCSSNQNIVIRPSEQIQCSAQNSNKARDATAAALGAIVGNAGATPPTQLPPGTNGVGTAGSSPNANAFMGGNSGGSVVGSAGATP